MVEKSIPKAPVAEEIVREEKTKFSIDLKEKVASLPEIKDKTKIDLRYALIVPYAYVHIYWDDVQGELIYNVEEPSLDAKEKEILELIKQGVGELINMSFISVKEKESLIEYLEKNINILLKEFDIKLEKNSYLKLMYYIYRDFVGLNRIEPLMNDYYIEDIECNGKKSPLYIVHRRFGNIKTNIVYDDFDELTNFVEKLAQKCGKYISYATPLLDGVLPEGSRVNATFTEDVTSRGPTFCFTDGYFQLSDGEVMKIEKLFEKCKNNFGFRIEKGNEIVEVNNMNCCGVDEKNLNQINSKLKTIIKLQPPEKLVCVKFNDGSEITTTTNHLFHVAGPDLNLIEAGNLKEQMFVPMPCKINVEGCVQTINVANLIKDFSYIHKVCVASSVPIKELVNSAISVYRDNFRNHRQQLSREYDVHNSYFYEILNRGSSISFEILDRMCDNVNNLGDLNVVVYGGGTKGKRKAVKVPGEVDEDLAYLAGAIISDGHLSRANIDVSCYEEGFKDAVISKLMDKFGKANIYYNGTRVYLCNLFIPYFFNKVFDIPYGKKYDIVKVPNIIFKSDNKIIASFVKGLFDGDGTCKSGLGYKTSSKQLAEELTYLLSRLGIYSRISSKDNMYRVTVPSIYEMVYMNKIGFNNKFKKLCLNELITKKYSDAKSYVNNGRVPSKPVLDLMKKLGLSKNKVIKLCNVDFSRLVYYDSLSKPFVRRIIPLFESEINKKNIKDHNLDYIKWLVNCGQEFVKIKSVEIFDNRDGKPVYDIELEPCKFFIAGNKPMNVFDTIRKFTREPWSPIKLMQLGTVSAEVLAYLWLLVENGSNILIVGGTGSGKTTFLNLIACFIPPQSRIVSIEDTRELSLQHENWLPSVARAGIGVSKAEGEKTGEITLFDLLKESFRQRPDYVIVGEIRGKEAYVLFQGMASGHPSLSTMHADDVATVIRRLQTPPINLSPSLVETLDAICLMTFAKVKGQETRKVRAIEEVISVTEGGKAQINVPFKWDPSTNKFLFKRESNVLNKLVVKKGIGREQLDKEFTLRSKLLLKLYKEKIFDFDEVQKIIHSYYKTPERVLKRFNLK